MKGVHIHKQLEFRVDVPKQDIFQGDKIDGTFVVKNRGSSVAELKSLTLALCCGDPKAVPGTAEANAVELISNFDLQLPWAIPAQAERAFAFSFVLDKNAALTSKDTALFFRYGLSPEGLAHAALTVQPHASLRSIYEILETAFQFVPKGQKSSKGWTDAKFKPSSSKRFATVNELTLGARFDDSALVLKFKFNVKKFEGADANGVKVGRGKSELEKRLEPKDFLLDGGYTNHAGIEAALNEALQSVATGF